MKIAAVGDIHVRTDNELVFRDKLMKAAEGADVLLLCGDLTDEGKIEEAAILRKELERIKVRVVAVLGNHDYEKGQEAGIKQLLNSEQITVLDGECTEINGVGFAGIKGFCGGFDKHLLPSWGEQLLKDMVQESVNETLHLENALNKLTTKTKIVLMHYAPIRQTVVGESEEIFPFLGVSRLSEPINSYEVSLVFHGHAHNGTYQGKTEKGIPVFNVAWPLLERLNLAASVHEVG